MRRMIILTLSIFLKQMVFSQSPCTSVMVISPVVAKPTDGSVVSATCSALVVKWKGNANQTYLTGAAFFNAATGKEDSSFATNVSCDKNFNCTAAIPVKAGTKVSWAVQAAQVIDGRTFYSYYLIGNTDLSIPSCSAPVTKTKDNSQNNKEVTPVKEQLLVYPNPAANEITIKWSSGFKGSAVITISDATGRTVRVLNVQKDQTEIAVRINVSTLITGLYNIGINVTNFTPLTARFLKE